MLKSNSFARHAAQVGTRFPEIPVAVKPVGLKLIQRHEDDIPARLRPGGSSQRAETEDAEP